MSPAQETKLMNAGGLVVLVGTIVLALLAYAFDAAFGFASGALLGSWMIVGLLKKRKDRRLLLTTLDQEFEAFPGRKPELKIGNSYGFEKFTLTFQSEHEMNAAKAAGHIKRFKAVVLELYGGDPESKYMPYDVDLAVRLTYSGAIDEHF